MGPRFYITGMGLDAGLLGSIQILLSDGRLTGARARAAAASRPTARSCGCVAAR